MGEVDKGAPLYHSRAAIKFPRQFQSKFPDSSARQYKNKFQSKTANKHPDKSASKFRSKTAKVFLFKFQDNKGKRKQEEFVKLPTLVVEGIVEVAIMVCLVLVCSTMEITMATAIVEDQAVGEEVQGLHMQHLHQMEEGVQGLHIQENRDFSYLYINLFIYSVFFKKHVFVFSSMHQLTLAQP